MTKQAGWKMAQILNDLETSVSRSDAIVHCEIARLSAVLSNRVTAVKAASCLCRKQRFRMRRRRVLAVPRMPTVAAVPVQLGIQILDDWLVYFSIEILR